jgi:hypothetical protein
MAHILIPFGWVTDAKLTAEPAARHSVGFPILAGFRGPGSASGALGGEGTERAAEPAAPRSL